MRKGCYERPFSTSSARNTKNRTASPTAIRTEPQPCTERLLRTDASVHVRTGIGTTRKAFDPSNAKRAGLEGPARFKNKPNRTKNVRPLQRVFTQAITQRFVFNHTGVKKRKKTLRNGLRFTALFLHHAAHATHSAHATRHAATAASACRLWLVGNECLGGEEE
jgi:hypothetical protein